MSRIHEALRRAEQERAAGLTAQKLEERQDAVAPGDVIVSAPPVSRTEAVLPAVAATVPNVLQFEEICAKSSHPQWKPNPNLLVFSNSDPFHTGTEQFRTLRSRLYRMRDSQPLHTILVSSAIPAEGKTLVAANLAHALARQQGSRVLLIDADFRSPRVHTLLGAPATPGMVDYLQGSGDELQVIQQGPEPGLCFIPAGTHVTHPSELISSDRMKQFLLRVKPAFDWIIIDSPPTVPVADASVLAGLCDGVLFVVRANSTPAETAKKGCKELRGAQILGVVLNTVQETTEYGAYYSGHAYGLPVQTKSKK